jgi:hypothetical protein
MAHDSLEMPFVQNIKPMNNTLCLFTVIEVRTKAEGAQGLESAHDGWPIYNKMLVSWHNEKKLSINCLCRIDLIPTKDGNYNARPPQNWPEPLMPKA